MPRPETDPLALRWIPIERRPALDALVRDARMEERRRAWRARVFNNRLYKLTCRLIGRVLP